MAAKKKLKKPCVVCLKGEIIFMGICEDCDSSWEEALSQNVSTIEWAANRVRALVTKGKKR